MNDTYFTDRDGTPLTGKIPVQLFFEGDGDTGKIRAAANGALASFLHAVNTSTLQQLNRTVILGSTARMRMSYSFGLVRVVIRTKKVQEPPAAMFHGGILIQAFGDVSPYPTEVRTSGKGAGKVGRPAAPGTAEEDLTNWLIVWIRGDKPLGLTPIADGNMAIYRIKDPLFGEYVEVSHDPRSFLLSTTATFADFYLCGRKVTNIPPMFTPVPGTFDLSTVRICTLGLTFDSFVTADAAEGAVIVALAQKLYVLHTRDRTETEPAPWQLLDLSASIAPEDINTFGSTITKVRNPDGSVVVTCSGTNGIGACSGFVVTFTDTGITGSLSLVHNGRIPARAAEETYTKTVRNEYGEIVDNEYLDLQVDHTVDTFTNVTLSLVSTLRPIYAYGRGSALQSYMRYYSREATAQQFRDVFAGGYLPINVPFELTTEWTMSWTAEPIGWTLAAQGQHWGVFAGVTGNYSGPGADNLTVFVGADTSTHKGDVGDGDGGITARYPPQFSPTFKITYLAAGTCTHSTGIADDVGRYSASFRKVYGGIESDVLFPVNIITYTEAEKDAMVGGGEFASSMVYSGGVAQTIIPPALSLRYPSRDFHTEAIAWRHRATQSGTITDSRLNSSGAWAGWPFLQRVAEGSTEAAITEVFLAGTAPGVDESLELIDAALLRAGKSYVLGGWADVWAGRTRHSHYAAITSSALASTISMPIEGFIGITDLPAPAVSSPFAIKPDGFYSGLTPIPKYKAVWSAYAELPDPAAALTEGDEFAYDFIYPVPDTATDWATAADYVARFPETVVPGADLDNPVDVVNLLNGGGFSPNPNKTRAVAGEPATWILRDVRTAGFLAFVNYGDATRSATLVGNRYGTIPFATAYSEWIRLGTAPMTGYDDTVGIRSTLRVSLL